MLGFIFGTICLYGLIKTIRGGCGYGYGRRGWQGRGGWGARYWLRGLFERLDTMPGQEKVILSEVEILQGQLSKLREESEKARADIASALRGEHVNQEALNTMFARHDQLLEEMKRTLSASVGKVHEALEPAQRKQLADLIEHYGYGYGGHGHRGHGGGCGRYRGYSQC